jgi:hypothetical protein
MVFFLATHHYGGSLPNLLLAFDSHGANTVCYEVHPETEYEEQAQT